MNVLFWIVFGIGIAAILGALVTGQRFYHNYQRKLETVNTYAIQNVKSGMNIRPYNAKIPDETEIIQYKHANWECMTWQLISLDDGSTLLKNLYTHKTFQPSASPEAGVSLFQKPLEANALQYWEFIGQPDETYLIRLKGTEFYVTVSDDKQDSNIILMPKSDADDQRWKLIEQHPVV